MATKSSFFKTIATIIATTCVTLSVAAGTIVVHAFKNKLPDNVQIIDGNENNRGKDGRSVVSIDKSNSYGLIDEYVISYSDGTTSKFIVANGADGQQGVQGLPGQDGHTPEVKIGDNGNWYIDGSDTGVHAQGSKGDNGQDGRSIVSIEKTDTAGLIDTYTITYSDNTTSTFIVANGANGGEGPQGIQGIPGADGHTPTISINEQGYWVIDGTATTFKATGSNGQDGRSITNIEKTNTNGLVDTYTITYSDGTESYFVVTNGADGQQGLQGVPGQDGHAPVITIANGHWVIDGVDSGINATGPQGPAGQDGVSIVSVEKTDTEGLVDTYTITYSNGNKTTFTVTNGAAGSQGEQGQAGHAPAVEIDANGFWVIDGVNTGVKAQGENGAAGQDGQDGNGIASIEFVSSANLVDTYKITFTNGSTFIYTIRNGQDGVDGKDGTSLITGHGAPIDASTDQNGDSYIDVDTWDFYVRENNAWVLTGNIQGATGSSGSQGQQGQAGQNGSSILTGSGEPTSIQGNDNDSYVDLATWNYYVKENGSWVLKGNFKGVGGQDGISIVSVTKTGSNGLIDTYTITYSNGTETTFDVINGANGENGQNGQDGHTPTVEIDSNTGNWVIDGNDTGVHAQGATGATGQDGNGISTIVVVGTTGLTTTYRIIFTNGGYFEYAVTNGQNGADGTCMRAGTGAPTDDLGANGDSYIDTDTWNYYVKANDSWVLQGNIKGAEGANGANIFTGNGVPTTQGVNGDSYIDLNTWNFYVKNNDAWTLSGNIKGDQGQQGYSVLTGHGEPAIDFGRENESYIDLDTWNFYVKDSTGWQLEGNIQGAQGQAGTNGTAITVGNGAPTAEAQDGDSYINLDTWDLYARENGAWVLKGNIHTSPNNYTVTFESMGGTPVSSINDAQEGQTINAPAEPTKDDVIFLGWYTAQGNKWNFEKDVVTQDITLVARWGTFKVVDGVLVETTAKGDVVIPMAYDGQVITAIGDSVFQDNDELTSVTIPSTVTYIGDRAFTDCDKLESVIIPSSVKEIADWAFASCKNMVYVYMNEGLEILGNNVFCNTPLKAVVVPNSVKSIGRGVFSATATWVSYGNLKEMYSPDATAANTITIGNNSDMNNNIGSFNPGDIYFTTDGSGNNYNAVFVLNDAGDTWVWKAKLPYPLYETSGKPNYSMSDPYNRVKVDTSTGDLYLFCGNTIESITLPFVGDGDTVTELSYLFDMPGRASGVPASLKNITITGDRPIEEDSLDNLKFVETITFTGKPTYIADGALEGCNSLKTITIPYIGKVAYEDTSSSQTPVTPTADYAYGENAPDANTNSNKVYVQTNPVEIWFYNFNHNNWEAMGFASSGANFAIGEGAPNISTSGYDGYIDYLNGMLYQNDNGNWALYADLLTVYDQVSGGGGSGGNTNTNQGPVYYFASIFGAPDKEQQADYIPVSLKTVIINGGNGENGDELQKYAFYGIDSIDTIIIKEGVKIVRSLVIYQCNVNKVVFPDSLEVIEMNTIMYGSVNELYIPYIGKSQTNTNGQYRWVFQELNVDTLYVGGGNGVNGDIIAESAFDSSDVDRVAHIKHIVLPEGIKYIGNYAFYECPDLVSVVLPSTLETIGDKAFKGCVNLTTISLPNNVYSLGSYAFSECTNLESVILPNSIREIQEYTFSECTNLKYIYLPSSLISIGDYAFNNSGLTYVIIPENVNHIGDSAFADCDSLLTIIANEGAIRSYGASLFSHCDKLEKVVLNGYTSTTFWNSVFDNCPNLKHVVLPTGMTHLSSDMFENCTKLETVVLPNTLDQIYSGAFRGCTSLRSISLPNGVYYIGDYAFKDCTSLAYVELNDGLLTIGRGVFENCTNLKSIVIPNSVTSIGNGVFKMDVDASKLESLVIPFVGRSNINSSYAYFSDMFGALTTSGVSALPKTLKTVIVTNSFDLNSQAFYNCKYIETIVIKGHVYSIGNNAFSGCTALTSLSLPETVTSIGMRAFMDCTNLKNINIPNTVKAFGQFAFYNCTSLESIILPDSMEVLVDRAFQNCTSLKYVYMKEGLKVINERTFSGCTSLESIVIPTTVTDMGYGIFQNCTSLASISMPFVGGSINTIGSHIHTGTLELQEIPDKTTGNDNDLYIDLNCYGIYRKINGAWYKQGFLTTPDVPSEISSIQVGNGDPNSNGATNSATFYVDLDSGDYYNYQTNQWALMGSVKDLFRQVGYLFVMNNDGSVTDVYLEAYDPFNYSAAPCNGYVPSSLKAITINNNCGSIYAKSFEDISSIETVTLTDGITEIGDEAFQYCTSLKSIRLPSTLITIGESAFALCSNLLVVSIPETVTSIGGGCFVECSSLEYAYFDYNSQLDTIPASCFDNCVSLKYVYIPNSVVTIEDFAFYNCKNLDTPLVFNNAPQSKLETIGFGAFEGCENFRSIYFQSKVKYIGEEAFNNCINLRDLSFKSCASTLVSIGNGAFYNCAKLYAVDYLENTNATIGERAFGNCSSLVRIGLPNSLETIENKVFENCTSLQSIVIPDSVTTIGEFAFNNCKSLKSISIPGSVTNIGKSAFKECIGMNYFLIEETGSSLNISGFALENCSSLKTLNIPDRVTNISLKDCNSLESISLPNLFNGTFNSIFGGVDNVPSSLKTVVIRGGTTIAVEAFKNCSSITTIVLPDTLTTIYERAFQNCTGLESLVIKGNIEYLGNGVFGGCASLKNLTIPYAGGAKKIGALTAISGQPSITAGEDNDICFDATTGKLYRKYDGGWRLDNTFAGTWHSGNGLPDNSTGVKNDYYLDLTTGNVYKKNTNSWSSSISFNMKDRFTSLSYLFGDSEITINSIVLTSDVDIGNGAFKNCVSLESIALTGNIKNIGNSAFYGCTKIKAIILPNSLKTIGDSAFARCETIESFLIPDSVTEIGNQVFKGCTSLKSLTVPFIGKYATDTDKTVKGYFFGDDECYLEEIIVKAGNGTDGDIVPNNAFKDCASLKTVVLPNNIVAIGDHAFEGCTSLESYVPGSTWILKTTALHGNGEPEDSLGNYGDYYFDVDAGKLYINAEYIGWYMMYDDSYRTGNGLPSDSVGREGESYLDLDNYNFYTKKSVLTSIGESAFEGCTNVKTIYLPQSVTEIGAYAFCMCESLESIYIPSGVTAIKGGTFSGCSKLKGVELGYAEHLTTIGSRAFSGCYELKSIYIYSQEEVTIAEYAFSSCGIETIGLSYCTIKSIGDWAFQYCDNLKTVITENATIESLGKRAFEQCASLEYISFVDTGLKTIGEYAFTYCDNLKTVVLPGSITKIENHIFLGCTSLETLTVPYVGLTTTTNKYLFKLFGEGSTDVPSTLRTVIVAGDGGVNVKEISNGAFAGCTYIENIIIGDGVTMIGERAFRDCTHLKTIELPSSITSIGENAFDGCNWLTTVYYLGSSSQWASITVTSTGNDTLANATKKYAA